MMVPKVNPRFFKARGQVNNIYQIHHNDILNISSMCQLREYNLGGEDNTPSHNHIR